MLIKTKNDKDFTQTVQYVYAKINNKYGVNARVSGIFEYLKEAFDIQEFAAFDPVFCQNASLESYLVNEIINWNNGESIDFGEIKDALMLAGDFVGSEKLIFQQGNIEERLWGIFLAITDPTNNNKIFYNK